MFRPNTLKQRLLAHQPAFGFVHTLTHAGVAELLGLVGSDFVLIDGEHGQGDLADHLTCLQALASTPATALVRLASDDPVQIKRILDFGAEGIMIPNVSTAEQAAKIVSACRYPPRGIRGYAASGVRASGYGTQTARYLADAEQELLIAVMIETGEGVRNAAAIAAIDGVDIVQIGANDLSYDLGVPEQLQHPVLAEAIKTIERAVRAAGKTLGGAPLPPDGIGGLRDKGYGLITLGRDGSLLAKALGVELNDARAWARRQDEGETDR